MEESDLFKETFGGEEKSMILQYLDNSDFLKNNDVSVYRNRYLN